MNLLKPGQDQSVFSGVVGGNSKDAFWGVVGVKMGFKKNMEFCLAYENIFMSLSVVFKVDYLPSFDMELNVTGIEISLC